MVASILAVSLMSVYDIANAVQQNIRVREVVRAGGIYAQTYPYDTTGITAAINNAASGWTNLTINEITPYCQCWNSPPTAFQNSVSCDNDCGSDQTQLGFVRIRVSRPFTAMFLPGLSGNTTATHAVRYQ